VWGITENVSETGILLRLDSRIPEGAQVELTLDLADYELSGIQLFAPGKVQRAETERNGSTRVAVACTHSLQVLTPTQVA